MSDLNNDLNPLDIFYNLLKCNIKVLNDDYMRNTIIDSVARTHGPTHDKFKLKVKEIYELERKNEKLLYSPFLCLHNRSNINI